MVHSFPLRVVHFFPLRVVHLNRYNQDHKSLHPRGDLEPVILAGDQAEEESVEIVDECGENHEDSVGLHLGTRQVAPAEVVIHTIEAAFGGRPLVVEHNDFLLAHVVVVGEDAAVDVPAVNDVGLAVLAKCPLHHEPV